MLGNHEHSQSNQSFFLLGVIPFGIRQEVAEVHRCGKTEKREREVGD